MTQPQRVSHSWETVRKLFPRTGRSDPDAKYHFTRHVEAVPDAEIARIKRTTRSATVFRAQVLRLIDRPHDSLPAIKLVTLGMIKDKIESSRGRPFTQTEVFSLLLRVQFPIFPQGIGIRDAHLVPETDLWKRICHDPFKIGNREYQMCFGIGKDGSSRVELIAYNLHQGFVSSETFYYGISE